MYFGEKTSKKYFLVNNSPLPTGFNVVFKKDDLDWDDTDKKLASTRVNKSLAAYNIKEPFYDGKEKTQKTMGCFPQKGIVPAYS